MLRACLALCGIVAIGCSNKAPEPKTEAPIAEAKGPPGPKASGKGFVVEVTWPESASINAEHAARVTLKPTAGYHVNKEFPTSLKVTAPADVTCANAEQTGDNATKLEEAEALFDVKCTATEAGEKKYEALFKFAVCTETTCDPKAEKLAWNVPVK